MNRVATLAELETHYSLTDVLDANEAFDLQMRADNEAQAEAMRKAKERV